MASTHLAPGTSGNMHASIGSSDAIDVREFSVQESMSSLFAITLVVLSDNEAIDFDTVLGSPGRFQLRSGSHERSWTGLYRHIEQVGAEQEGLSTYRLTLVPELWLATQRRNHRMFQQLSELDIALLLLDEWSIPTRVKVTSSYKKRKYRVQYAESDYTFLCRLLEDAGISFYFAPAGDGTTEFVLSDAPHREERREPAIPFRDDVSLQHGEHLTRVRVAQQVRPGRYIMRDHDYRRHPTNQPLSSAEASSVAVEKRLERYHYTPGAFLFGTDKGDATPSADDRGKTRVDDAEAALLAQKRLEAKRASARVCTFETNALDLAPGVVMSMEEHPRPDLDPSHKLLVVETTLEGTSVGAWTQRCEARSGDLAYRPPLSTPKPRALGAESATVVGPRDEEIHTDEFGRVRVHFHWDRESQMDEQSSCWIHVSQPWGGSGFGGINLPRVGQEVLVEFLGGDPDRPVIVGRLFTNLQKVPYKLPASKTQSGWKSSSTNKTGGYNEIMFEDAAGQELVRIQAERNLSKLVKNDETITVGHDRTKVVKNNEDITIGKNLTKHVKVSEREVTGVSRNIVVGVNRSAQIGGVDSTMVGETHVVMVAPPGESLPESATSMLVKHKKIVFSTGAGAKITMEGAKITLSADMIYVKGKKHTFLRGKRSVRIRSTQGPVHVNARDDLSLGSEKEAWLKARRNVQIRTKRDTVIKAVRHAVVKTDGIIKLNCDEDPTDD
ncbi:type VI secretion system Vgr family protein [Chondromyces apiculatus]|uniref:VgrG protein n=1 Tax=Chondromyces apiculatus DSM 436 TaxID=1192034 RepID=A0A017T0B3_9BACT|nr:type VI secretion system tip protein TssI/VgrG [Chondromyces apiculatus]EYF02648.1 VgrG protein [Chondromyces apiculatus DSM 436]